MASVKSVRRAGEGRNHHSVSLRCRSATGTRHDRIFFSVREECTINILHVGRCYCCYVWWAAHKFMYKTGISCLVQLATRSCFLLTGQ